jgi:hypothetical protein
MMSEAEIRAAMQLVHPDKYRGDNPGAAARAFASLKRELDELRNAQAAKQAAAEIRAAAEAFSQAGARTKTAQAQQPAAGSDAKRKPPHSAGRSRGFAAGRWVRDNFVFVALLVVVVALPCLFQSQDLPQWLGGTVGVVAAFSVVYAIFFVIAPLSEKR